MLVPADRRGNDQAPTQHQREMPDPVTPGPYHAERDE